MIIKPLCQQDPRWKNVRIGKSAATVGRYGCTLTSICMGGEKARGYGIDPGNAARFWKFTSQGLIDWEKCKFKGFKYIKRGHYADYKKVEEYANSPQNFAIIEVNNGAHWLYVERVQGKELRVIDPWDGKRYTGLPYKYKFTGYALFEAEKIEIPESLQPLMKKAQARGLTEKDPARKMTLDDVLESLSEMKLIDVPKTEITVGEFLAALDKIAERWGGGGGGF